MWLISPRCLSVYCTPYNYEERYVVLASLCIIATLAPTRESEAVCVVTLDAYKLVYGNGPAEETGTGVGAVGQSRSVFGWREKDGAVENFPTDDSEKVFVGDSVLVHDEVHINPCHTWYDIPLLVA